MTGDGSARTGGGSPVTRNRSAMTDDRLAVTDDRSGRLETKKMIIFAAIRPAQPVYMP